MTAASTLAGWCRSGVGSSARRAFALIVAALVAGASPVAVLAQPQPASRATTGDPYAGPIADAARRFAIPEGWIRAVMKVESAGDPHAVSPKGAMGLMQIMPATWEHLRARHGLGRDPFDTRDNILAGAAYLRELFDRYGSPGFLAAYNAGPGRYEASFAGRPLPAVTRAYVAAIAPVIGSGSEGGPVRTAAADPQSWTRAPLFIVQRVSSTDAEPVSDARPQDSDSAAVAVQDHDTNAPQTGGLFVARTQPGMRP